MLCMSSLTCQHSCMSDSTIQTFESRVESGRRRLLVAVAVATGLVTTVLVGFGGYLLGTVDGDVPWPATAEESGTYNAGRTLVYVAVGAALAGATALILLAKHGRYRPLPWALVTVAVTALVALAVFAGSYALGG